MRYTTVFSLLATGLALFSREDTVFSPQWTELTFFLNQSHLLPTLLQLRTKLARQLKSATVWARLAGWR